ncbi:flagellar hook assembly protein FlgD [Granulosicoccus sp. 3-233]|uniref:flagellar hook assembly protein FlgD n=1 Tax=Granulosicoccus sp. 3-233 TaxID=3417969 RepID=UPI003D358F66
MATVSAATLNDQYTLSQATTTNHTKELGQDEFLELMTAQLENQDPMAPMDNGEFLGQMAQFSTVSGIEAMQESLDNLSATYATGQTLQSVQLVGQEVMIESGYMELPDSGPIGGSFELDAGSGKVRVDIADASGTVVRQIDLGEYPAGRHDFTWNGLNEFGERVSPGSYQAVVTAQQGEEFVSASVLSTRIIDSVEFGAGGAATLNTRQGEILTLADIRQIRSVAPDTASESEQ